MYLKIFAHIFDGHSKNKLPF